MQEKQHWAALALAGTAVLLIRPLRTAVLPFALALFLAGCLQRPIDRLAQHHIPRWVSAAAILILVLSPLLLLAASGAFYLVQALQSLAEAVVPLLRDGGLVEDWLYRQLIALPPAVQDVVETALDALDDQKEALLSQVLTDLGSWSSGLLSSLPARLGEAGIFLLSFLFCAIGYPELTALLRRSLPKGWRRRAAALQRTAQHQLGRWCAAQGRVAGLIFLELALGLAILGVRRWPLFAALTALIDLVPLVGSGLILLPWAVLRLLLGEKLQALGLALLWCCCWLTRTTMEPRLVGRQLQIPAALSFFAAVLGAKLWGLKGVILFPVLAAVGASLLSPHRDFPET